MKDNAKQPCPSYSQHFFEFLDQISFESLDCLTFKLPKNECFSFKIPWRIIACFCSLGFWPDKLTVSFWGDLLAQFIDINIQNVHSILNFSSVFELWFSCVSFKSYGKLNLFAVLLELSIFPHLLLIMDWLPTPKFVNVVISKCLRRKMPIKN